MQTQAKLLIRDQSDWKGTIFVREFYEADSIPAGYPITQAQAVCFTGNGDIVFYKEISGGFGLPGGGVEDGETPNETLRREINEEIAADTVRQGLIGFVKVWKQQSPDKVDLQLRYWAEVLLRNEPVQDPCKNSIGRVIINKEEASKKLQWGKWGEILIKTALARFRKIK